MPKFNERGLLIAGEPSLAPAYCVSPGLNKKLGPRTPHVRATSRNDPLPESGREARRRLIPGKVGERFKR